MADFIDGIVKRRGGAPADDGGDAAPAKAPGYGDAKKSALDDLARIVGVMKADRGAFDAAMTDFVEACMEDEEKETPADESAEGDDTETPEE